MNNPFLIKLDNKSDYFYLDSKCSINKVMIAKVPYSQINDDFKLIEGKSAIDIFSTKVITEYIKTKANELKIDLKKIKEKDLAKQVSICLLSNDKCVRDTAEAVVKRFGYRLGMIFLTLKTGLKENRKARPDWGEQQWDFWASLEKIILVGGLSNDSFGEGLKKYANELFNRAGVKPYEILLFNNASHLGIMGCTRLIKAQNSVNIVFDFGQTNIKRSIVTKVNGDVIDEHAMPSIDSKYMDLEVYDEPRKTEMAKKLHSYLMRVIVDTYNEVSLKHSIGNEIVISIASYVVAGKLNEIRGGYAKLTALSENYSDYLQSELKNRLGVMFEITLIHDGSAIALHFKEYQNTVCISIGTAFGVGFPN